MTECGFGTYFNVSISRKEIHMFCRNCGSQLPPNASEVCPNCGTIKGNGNKYCPNCKGPTAPGDTSCNNCGTILLSPSPSASSASSTPLKSKMLAGLLAIFLGSFGVHNFYLGYTTKAVIQVSITVVSLLLICCTGGLTGFITMGIGIWALVEGIMILVGKIDRDGQGRPLAD